MIQTLSSPHSLPPGEVLDPLGVQGDVGLAADEVERRLLQYGPNQLPEEAPPHPLIRFLRQFHNVLIYVLLGAAVFTAFLEEWVDAGVILLVVLVNATVGFIQEGKAAEALEGIRSLLSPTARVLRDGEETEVDATALVPGDIVLLESGDRVPADLRILSALQARVDEAILTGESVPVEKSVAPVAPDALPADQTCMVFSGTLVAAGRVTGVVTATGVRTEIGQIGRMVSEVEGVTTPLLRQIDQFGRQLSLAIVGAAVVIFLVGWKLRAMNPTDAFMAVVALVVAAIPEGLPAILTITLALGVQRMASRNAIVRRLPAVETLGSVNVICTDKTGTLTRNEMAVERVLLPTRDLIIRGEGYEAAGDVLDSDGQPVRPEEDSTLQALARVAVLCSEASLRNAEGRRVVRGDPTEGALLVMGERFGLDFRQTRKAFAREVLLPFESERQWMATVHRHPSGERELLLKGAPERILPLCGVSGWEERTDAVAGEGYRLLALAHAPLKDGEALQLEADALEAWIDGGETTLTLLGIVAIMDPPRAEAAQAVSLCKQAGVRVMMITGDHALTARSIGARLGIGDGTRALQGHEVEAADEDALREALACHDVIARAGPGHKLRIVQALQAEGAVCAMTGDGVNDAPALKQADIGVAMGIKGTEAAKGASEMVLADDNFASIERAIEEGRTVYDNLKKTILFILPTNGAEALIVLAGVALALGEFPITPVQILWVNMITAVTLALALAFEPAEPGIMSRPPRRAQEPFLSKFLLRRILYVSVLVSAACVVLFQWQLGRGAHPDYARTSVVNALVAAQLWYLFTCRFQWQSSVGWHALVGNRAILIAAGSLIAFQLAFTYLPIFHTLFATQPLAAASWIPVLGVGLMLYGVVEAEKAWGRRQGRVGAPEPSE